MTSHASASSMNRSTGIFGRTLISLDNSKNFRPVFSFSIFLIGLSVWLAVQGSLTLVPLWTRALPPEIDDSLTYVLKSRQMEDCFNQDCRALNTLRWQLLYGKAGHRASYEERVLASSRIFPVYHPLFSFIIVALHKTGFDWITAYKVIWTAGPLIFGLAFAYLLVKLWGLSAAGLALGLLAFKIFPDTGLHTVVPSNLTMAMAAAVWARIISKNGKAMITLIAGSVLMLFMHPIGMLYAVMAVVMTLSIPWDRLKPVNLRTWLPLFIVLGMVVLSYTMADIVKGPFLIKLHFLPDGKAPLLRMLSGTVENLTQFIAGIVRLEGGLLGNFIVFCGAVVFGFLTMPWEKRKIVVKFTLIYVFFLFSLMFYVSSHPADVIFRMWIPLVVVLFGAVGQALRQTLENCWGFLLRSIKNREFSRTFEMKDLWPAVVLALLLGYSIQMTIKGTEQVYALSQHMEKRQPLRIEPSQPQILLAEADHKDLVLYTSVILMPYYFIHGAMDLGAVYYHPSMKGSNKAERWLNMPELRFAVTYNPTVYHPSYSGLKESDWWVQNPPFHFSPLNRRRHHRPISREGMVPVSQFRWIQVRVHETLFPEKFLIYIKNPGEASEINLVAFEKKAGLRKGNVKKEIPAGYDGWMEFDLNRLTRSGIYRILLPRGRISYLIGGITFGNHRHNWPWDQKADVSFMFKDADTGLVTLSFDPAKILPAPLNKMRISVLDDRGSSVLFKIHQ